MGIQIGGQTVIHDTYHVTDIINVNASGIITATKFKGDGSELEGIVSGIGINSTGTSIGADITTLNFVGAGNTFAVNGSTVDISISGEGGTPVIDAGDFNSASSLVSESTEIEGGDFG